MSEAPASGTVTGLLARVAVCVALSAAFTALILHYSQRHGKLLTPLYHDDAGYFVDGLTRLDTLYAEGIPGLARAHLQAPPHAPFSTYLALSGFAVLGIQDWAPYAANVLIVFVLLVFVDHLFRDVPLPWRLLPLLFVLTVPWAGEAVFEFRPDMACGLLTAMGALLTLQGPFLSGTGRHLAAAGACFGLALLAKPIAFPLTIAIGAAAPVLATWIDRTAGGGVAAAGRSWRAFLLPAVLVPLPHLAFSWRHYLGYLDMALFAEKKPIASLAAGWLTHARFYVDGPGGRLMLGAHAYLFVVLVLACAVRLAGSPKREDRLRIAARLLVTAIALAVPTLSPVKQGYLGIGFAVLLCLVALESMGAAVRERGGWGTWSARAALLGLLAAGIWCFQWPPREGDRRSPVIEARNRLAQETYRALTEDGSRARLRVFFTTTGSVNSEYLQYLALKDGRKGIRFVSHYLSDDIDAYRKQMDEADYVVASEPGNSESLDRLPSGRIERASLDLVRSRRDYVKRAEIPTFSGRSYVVFERIHPFFGWSSTEGILDEEGPDPQRNLPVVRWGCGPASVLTIRGRAAGRKTLVASARSDLEGQEMTILVDGVQVGRHIFSEPGRFDELKIPLTLERGSHDVELRYSVWEKAWKAPRKAVAFKTLQVVD